MRVSHVNASDVTGGAARAAYRIHRALCQHGVDSTMLVNHASGGDWTVHGPTDKWRQVLVNSRSPLGYLFSKTLKTDNPTLHSPNILPSGWRRRLNTGDADVVNLHWINYEMLSISDIGRIRKPVVWTLHDLWAFCGAEHYTEDFRWREGYTRSNRPLHESGFDLNRWTWHRKRRLWRHPMHIVTPSRWLANCVRQSALMHDWPVTIIPNAIDTDFWQPADKILARQLLKLPLEGPLLLFGAMGGAKDPRKGFDLLQSALRHLQGQMPGLELVVFGQMAPEKSVDLGFPIHYTGHLYDDVSLVLLYSAADAMVIPSRQDNLPNTGLESFACGTPVVSFNTCGLPDIVTHQQTGYLAKAFDAIDLAKGLQWTLKNPDRCASLGQAARAHAQQLWSYKVVAPQYLRVYQQAVELHNNA